MLELRRARDRARDGRVRNHILEEELTPAADIDIGRPRWQLATGGLTQQRAPTPAQRNRNHYCNPALERQRQYRLRGFAIAERVIDLNEVDWKPTHIFNQLWMLIGRHRGDPDVADFAAFLQSLQQRHERLYTVNEMRLHEVDVLGLQPQQRALETGLAADLIA